MIATILPSSSNFHAVSYNEKKVSEGNAYLLEIKNFGILEKLGYDSPEELINYLNLYSSRNSRVKKPQFHVAISCKGNEMTHDELLEFAHEYLKEMGYGDEKQPLLVYAHRDTENNHIHIISSKVNPDGQKIKDGKDWIQSQKILDRLLDGQREQKVKEHISKACEYNYRSVTQFQAIMESMGYECFEKDRKLNIKKGGMVITGVNLDEIEAGIDENINRFEEPNYKQLYGILLKYRELNTDIAGLKKDIKKKFGLDLIFFGRKDSPYGFVIVDHNNKKVIEGSKVMNIKRLFQFQSSEERLKNINSFIQKCLEENPLITLKELNQKIKRHGARISKGFLYYNKSKISISESFTERLNINNKLSWIYSFKPRSIDEFNVLAKNADLDMSKIKPELKFNSSPYDKNKISDLKQIVNSSKNLFELRNTLRENNYLLLFNNGKYFAYDNKNKIIVDLNKAGIKINDSTKNNIAGGKNLIQTRGNNNILNNKQSDHGTNREWEVGTNGKWDDVDNGPKLN